MQSEKKSNNYPSSIDIEKTVLGAVLKDNNSYDRISDLLSPDDFYEKIHQIIYKAIVSKLETGQLADPLTLMYVLSENSIHPDYLQNLIESVYSSENIRQYSEILVELSTRRKLIDLGNILEENAQSAKPVKEQIDVAEKLMLQLYNVSKFQNKTINLFEGSKAIIDNVTKIIESGKRVSGVSTGFADLDNLIGGLRKGELFVLAGRPSTGKTAFALNIALKAAADRKYGGKVLFISIEMPYEQIIMRCISSLSGVPLNLLIHSKISKNSLKECMDTMIRFRDLPLNIHDSAYMTLSGIRSILRQMRRKNEVDLVIIDYLQLIETGGEESREQEISKISRNLKLIAKEANIPMIALSQMSRDIEKRKDGSNLPKLSDLRGSGSIEQDADVIGFLHRENPDDRSQVTLLIAKNRNGALGEIRLFYDGETTTFKNLMI